MLRKKNLPLLECFFWVFFLHSALISTEASGLSGQAPITQLTQKDVNQKVDFTYHSMNLMKTHENNLMDHAKIISGTPDHGAFISYAPEPEALSRGRAGWIAVGSTAMMISRHCSLLYTDECANEAMKYSLSQTSMHDFCKNLTTRCTQKEYLSAYRSITGFCNHYGHEGESFSAYKRLLAPDYLDGVGTPRRAESRYSLPSARFISLNLTTFETPQTDGISSHTLAMLQWGQFLEQDLSRPAVSLMYHFDVPFTCCDERGFKLAPRYKHKFCSLIEIPGNDPYYNQHIVYCMNYVRSLPAVRPDCSFGPGEQLNQATHYLDGSQIYGSSLNKSSNMRDFSNGQLKMSEINNKNYLSLSSNPSRDCLYPSDDSICFTSGDPRVNFEPQMTVIHTIWAREHNRIVKELTALNDEWTSNELYEEARRIVIAEIQHITYNEWLPELLAKKYVNEINKYTEFSEKVSPSVLNSVGNAVLRAFKSMYPNKLRILSEDRKEVDSLILRKHFYKPEILSKPGIFDGLIRGLTTQTSGKVDRQYSEDFINHLYNEPPEYGYDMLALDIQRGRDHGLPAYHKFRSYLGFQSTKSFNDFYDVMSADNVRDLENVYTSANDVDLIIGGLLERPVATSLFGPTFSWLLTNQMDRTRRGDRYFYTNTKQPKPFSESQLEEIKKVTFARILCDNSDDVKKMQPNVFKLISDSNRLVNCNSGDIPHVDLAAWKL